MKIISILRDLLSDRERRDVDDLSSEKELSKIYLKKNEIEQKFRAKESELNNSFEREKGTWGDMVSEQTAENERRLGDLEEQKNAELSALDIEKSYQTRLVDRRDRYKKKTNLLLGFIIVLVIVFIVVIVIDVLSK